MGILDQKERVIDTIITAEGKEQLAKFGRLNPTFYSFSDINVVYNTDTVVTGSTLYGMEVDETFRYSFEAMSMPQDNIIFERNEDGKIQTNATKIIIPTSTFDIPVFIKNGEFFVYNRILAYFTPQVQGIIPLSATLPNSQEYKDFIYSNITKSIYSFNNQHILRSPDITDNVEKQFLVYPLNITYSFSDTQPITNKSNQEADINHVESIFQDKRLSHVSNFQFLPPVFQEQIGTTELKQEFDFSNTGQNPILAWSDLKNDLNILEQNGMSKDILFQETSNDNNIFAQIFEISNGIVSKPDIIDFGLFSDNGVKKHVFFIGKLFRDSNDQSTFVNVFTLVVEMDG